MSKASVTRLSRKTADVLMAADYGPITITRRGDEVAVVISSWVWESIKNQAIESYRVQEEHIREHWADVADGLDL